jgi:branched-subunit amino acid transport protein
MSWALVLGLAFTAYAFKVFGLVVVGDRTLPPRLARCLDLIPAALVAAIVMKDTFSTGQRLGIDARAAGVFAAVVAAWRRAPLILVIVLGAAVTAAFRRFA